MKELHKTIYLGKRQVRKYLLYLFSVVLWYLNRLARKETTISAKTIGTNAREMNDGSFSGSVSGKLSQTVAYNFLIIICPHHPSNVWEVVMIE